MSEDEEDWFNIQFWQSEYKISFWLYHNPF